MDQEVPAENQVAVRQAHGMCSRRVSDRRRGARHRKSAACGPTRPAGDEIPRKRLTTARPDTALEYLQQRGRVSQP